MRGRWQIEAEIDATFQLPSRKRIVPTSGVSMARHSRLLHSPKIPVFSRVVPVFSTEIPGRSTGFPELSPVVPWVPHKSQPFPPSCRLFPGNPRLFHRRASHSPGIPAISHGLPAAPGNSQDVLFQQVINSKAEMAVVVGQASSLSPTVNDLEKTFQCATALLTGRMPVPLTIPDK
jgi:hypothetical protein